MADEHRNFIADGTSKVWEYEPISFKTEGGQPQSPVDESDLLVSGELTVAIKDPENPSFVAYQTIQLPWESWEQIEWVLGIDWGEEGSRLVT